MLACSVGLGIYSAEKFGKKWQRAIRGITERMDRDMKGKDQICLHR